MFIIATTSFGNGRFYVGVKDDITLITAIANRVSTFEGAPQ